MLRRTALFVSALAGLLAACGGGSRTDQGPATSPPSTVSGASTAEPTTRSTETAHNEADVLFAQRMMPFNAQAISMADVVAARSSNEDVKALASTIRAEQAPQIDLLYSLLTTWGKPPAGHEGTGSLDGVPGVVTDDQIAPIYQATGVELDRLYLTLMAQHHRAAIELSKAELASGLNSQTLDLAQWTKSTRTVQLGKIEALALRLP